MSSLSHPNIAAVHDWGEEQVGKRTTVFAVVEHLSGGSLRDLFDRGRYLDPSQALVVGLEACRGLDFAHRKGLVHTELTPAKLVFGDDRRLRIVDFGLARLLGEHDWSEPATVATHVARYSSPEQALGQPIDGKTDVYSLALILVEAVTGTVPFAARSTVATLSARIGRLMPVSADLGPLASVLEKAGRPEPADRSTAAELGRSLVRTAENLPRPKPIPLLITGLFEDDPARLRRPNDPTGGITRPAPADEPVALVPPVPAPEQPATERRPVPPRRPRRPRPPRPSLPGDRSHSGQPRPRPTLRRRRHRRCRRPSSTTSRRGSTTATPTAPSTSWPPSPRRPPLRRPSRWRHPPPTRAPVTQAGPPAWRPWTHGRSAPAVAGLARRHLRGRRPRRTRVPRLPAVPRPHPRGAGSRRSRRGGGRGADRRLRLGARRGDGAQ